VSDDLELLAAWRDGDRGAGDRLLRRHFASLHRFFASKVGDEAEDLIQNTMLACVTYIDKVSKATSFRAYLFTVASNQLYAHLRKHAREGEIIDFTVKSAVELGLSPSAIVAKRQRDQQLSAALRRLPFELQIVLELGYWEGLNAREIADVLELPVGTAKSKIRRAKQLLARELERLTRPPLGPPARGESEDEAEGAQDDQDDQDDLGAWVRTMRDALPGLGS
jgi:RNA polymerase sigma factor (sigma-70 family)